MMIIIYILFLLIFVLIGSFATICMKIKLTGINVRDFFKFILAINDLDCLYNFANQEMTKKEQLAFVKEAEKIFKIFEKIPTMIWEEEYEKYSRVLETYRDIRVLEWAN